MRVTRLPVDPGPAGWNRLLPDQPPAAPLEGAQTADWLIIGAGFAGLAAARRLQQLDPGGRIVVLEASRVAEGPAGRNSGFMIDLPHDLASDDYGGNLDKDAKQTRANRHGIRFAAQMAEAFALSQEAFNPCGKINGAATVRGHQHNLDYAAHLAAMGEAHEIFDAARMRAITGSDYYQSGLFTPGTVIIQPAAFVRGVAGGLCGTGVSIFENSPVTALDHRNGWIAKTPAGKITAPKVILAVNGHANSFGHYKRQLLHVFTYASMTRAMTRAEIDRLGGAPDWGLTPADPMGSTVRRISGLGGHRLVIRNRFSCDPTMEISAAKLRRATASHDADLAARFPTLAGIEMEHRWGGRLCLGRNGATAFGELAPGLFSACCQNGLGTAQGTLHGLLAAELAAGHRSDLLSETLAGPIPARLPPAPLTAVGANAFIRWNEWRAGAEK